MEDGASSRTTAETLYRARTTRGQGPASGRDSTARWPKLFLHALAVAQVAWEQVIVPFGSGFLLGRAVILDTLNPFGTAYVVALAAVGHRGRALVAAVGVLGAVATNPTGIPASEPAPILIFVWLLAAGVGRLFDLPAWVNAVGALLGAATLRVVAAAFGGESVTAAGLAGVVDLSAALALLPVAEHLFGGSGGPKRRRRSPASHMPLDAASVASLILFVGLLLLGTQGLQWNGYSPYSLLTRTTLLLAALSGGVGAGATVGTLLGLLALLGYGDVAWEGVLFASAGLAAGLGSVYGRPGALLGLLVAHLLLSVYAPDGPHIGSALLHSLLAGAAVAFVPRKVLHAWRTRVELVMAGGAARRHAQATAANIYDRLDRLAHAFEQAGAVFAGDGTPAASGAVTLTRVDPGPASWNESGDPDSDDIDVSKSVLTADMGNRRGMDSDSGVHPGLDGDLTDTILQFGMDVGTDPNETEKLDRFVHDVFETVCRGCSHQSVCWETYAYETYRDALALAADALSAPDGRKSRPVRPRHVPIGLRQRCIKPQHFAQGVDKLLAVTGADAPKRDQFQGAHPPMQRQLTGIADIIAGIAHELSRMGGHSQDSVATRSPDKPRFQLQTDYVHVPGDDSIVSGDCFQRVDLADGRVAFIVCDGMGSGPRAAVESRAVVAMLRRLLEAGFDLQFCMQTINAVMLLRATEESFVTVDVCVVDLRDGTARMLKTGAAPTFIHRGRAVEMVRADSLPVGILPKVDVYEAERQLHLGDVLIMMSDGGLDLGNARGDKAEAVRRQMQRLERPRPRQVVDSLFARAHQSSGRRLPDDVTIVAAQLLPAVIPSL